VPSRHHSSSDHRLWRTHAGYNLRDSMLGRQCGELFALTDEERIRSNDECACPRLKQKVAKSTSFVCPDPSVLNDLGPFDDIGFDDGGEFLGRATKRIETKLGEFLACIGLCDDL
jgi:hypothetical protein